MNEKVDRYKMVVAKVVDKRPTRSLYSRIVWVRFEWILNSAYSELSGVETLSV